MNILHRLYAHSFYGEVGEWDGAWSIIKTPFAVSSNTRKRWSFSWVGWREGNFISTISSEEEQYMDMGFSESWGTDHISSTSWSRAEENLWDFIDPDRHEEMN